MDLTTDVLSGFLDDAWDATKDQANSLRTQFRSYETSLNSQFATTGSIAAVSKNSASQSYRGPGLHSYNLPQLAAAWRTLIRLYDQTKSECDYLYQSNDPCFLAQWGPNGIAPQAQQYAVDPDYAIYSFCNNWLAKDFTQYGLDITELRIRESLPGLRGVRTW